jgi:hypothetical protein
LLCRVRGIGYSDLPKPACIGHATNAAGLLVGVYLVFFYPNTLKRPSALFANACAFTCGMLYKFFVHSF